MDGEHAPRRFLGRERLGREKLDKERLGRQRLGTERRYAQEGEQRPAGVRPGTMQLMRLSVVGVFLLLCVVGFGSLNGTGGLDRLQGAAKQLFADLTRQRLPDSEEVVTVMNEDGQEDKLYAQDQLAQALKEENAQQGDGGNDSIQDGDLAGTALTDGGAGTADGAALPDGSQAAADGAGAAGDAALADGGAGTADGAALPDGSQAAADGAGAAGDVALADGGAGTADGAALSDGSQAAADGAGAADGAALTDGGAGTADGTALADGAEAADSAALADGGTAASGEAAQAYGSAGASGDAAIADGAAAPPSEAAYDTGSDEVQEAQGPVAYVIQKGDTLIGISKSHYGTDAWVSEICKLNHIVNPDDIYFGQKILLP